VPEQAVILLAEDREDDILIIRRAFQRAGLLTRYLWCVMARRPLRISKAGADTLIGTSFRLPELLLLDLKMPKMDGFEVLKWIRQQPGFSSLRVVVLTSSDAIRDVNVAYHLGANSFMVKPMDFENVVELSKVIQDYWLRKSKTPQASREPNTGTQKPRSDS